MNIPKTVITIIWMNSTIRILPTAPASTKSCMLTCAHKAVVVTISLRRSPAMEPVKLLWSRVDKPGLAKATGGR